MPERRSEIKKEDKWNVEAIYKSDQIWEQDYKKANTMIENLSAYQNTLAKSAKHLAQCLQSMLDTERLVNKLYIYAHMQHDTDLKNEQYKKLFDLATTLSIKYGEFSAWFKPELMKIDDQKLQNFLVQPDLKEYQFHITKLLRLKKYTLSEREEKLLSLAENALTTASETFRALNDADLRFGTFTADDHEFEITHGQYYSLIIHQNRSVREQAFRQYHQKYQTICHTMTSLITGELKKHVFFAKARGFDSTLQQALYYHNIDPQVYTNLIDTVHKRIDVLHNYLAYRQKEMKLNKLHIYDLYMPFVKAPSIKLSFSEAQDIILKSTEILGQEYTDSLQKGLSEQGWIDKFENENKRSGAYSTGCYDTAPYILMNYDSTLNSARTLAHELGHSMHSYLTTKYQSPVYGEYPIFLAEVASTFNEQLFINEILKNTQDQNVIAYLLNLRIEEMRATLFRQTMFAEFELKIHQYVEQGQPLTASLLSEEYGKLNRFYFGEVVELDEEIKMEWARIPHFYYNYYVYQYATGISAAIALHNRVKNGGHNEINDYLSFLKSGSSQFPLETLQMAGVNMKNPHPIESAIDFFDQMVQQLKEINH
ncbi:MAG: oligoendopeptidase F [Spirochaetes bacterium]|nr:oligoendopeptidase F [Spirochaetota bacterium]